MDELSLLMSMSALLSARRHCETQEDIEDWTSDVNHTQCVLSDFLSHKMLPDYETPAQFERRTGQKVDDDAGIFVRPKCHPSWWHRNTWGSVKDVDYDGLGYIVVLAEKGKGAPPDDWRLE